VILILKTAGTFYLLGSLHLTQTYILESNATLASQIISHPETAHAHLNTQQIIFTKRLWVFMNSVSNQLLTSCPHAEDQAIHRRRRHHIIFSNARFFFPKSISPRNLRAKLSISLPWDPYG